MPTAPYTHFISLPIANAEVQRKVSDFQARAKLSAGFQNAANSSFVNPATMHVTLGMLRLQTPFEVGQAVALLRSLDKGINDILDGQPLKVRLCGLETMEQDPGAARILYARVEDAEETPGRLQRMCMFVREAFDMAGYIDEKRELKIHMTVVRANESKRAAGSGKAAFGKRRPPFTVDVRELLQDFGQGTFGTCRIEQVQIARRFRFTESGAYANDGFLTLP
ncbi:activating signal cointegrator 1 complex subunit [Coemansia sp. RSA 2559]|nr:activating signal cointegrator 1 complex subunit [Coemansia sp. RSA 2559]